MPDYQAHLDKARANTQVYESLRESGLPVDWQVVVLFYAAVHYVEAMAAIDGIHNETHVERELYIRNNHPEDFWVLYDQLKQESLKARYLSNSKTLHGSAWRNGAFTLTPEAVKKRLFDTTLNAIRVYTERRMPKPRVVTLVTPPTTEPAPPPGRS